MFINDRENYFSRARFTVENDYTLRVIAIMPSNPAPNLQAPCDVYIFSERNEEQNGDMNEPVDLNEPVWNTRIDRLNIWNPDEMERNWVVLHLPELEELDFAAGESFSIIYGPAPGGPINGENPGWWTFYSRDIEIPESFVAQDIEQDHRLWDEGRLNGSLIVTAGGFFPVENTPPRWVNVPREVVEMREGETTEFIINGEDDDGQDLEIRFVNDNLPREAFFRDVGNNYGVFTWTPGYESAGEYACTFVLSDGEDEIPAQVRFNV